MSTKVKIKVRDAVSDVRSGMTDSQLMEKYGLSSKGLQSLIRKLVETKAVTPAEIDQRRASYQDTIIIKGLDEKEIVEDIRAGMSDSDLIKKYSLSSGGLQRIFRTLIDSQVLTVEDLYRTTSAIHDTVFLEDMRALPRHYLAMPVVIYEAGHPENRCRLNDITEKGIGTAGMAARVGEIKTFVIPTLDLTTADSVVFEAECRWSKAEEETGEWHAGFLITRISDACLEDLRRLIQFLPFLE